MGVAALRLLPPRPLVDERLLGRGEGRGIWSQIGRRARDRRENAIQVGSMGVAQPRGHPGANVAALRRKARVPQVVGHERVPEASHALHIHAALRRGVRKAEARQGGYDQIKRVCGIAAVTARVGQEGKNLGHLDKAAGPAVGHDQGHGAGRCPVRG